MLVKRFLLWKSTLRLDSDLEQLAPRASWQAGKFGNCSISFLGKLKKKIFLSRAPEGNFPVSHSQRTKEVYFHWKFNHHHPLQLQWIIWIIIAEMGQGQHKPEETLNPEWTMLRYQPPEALHSLCQRYECNTVPFNLTKVFLFLPDLRICSCGNLTKICKWNPNLFFHKSFLSKTIKCDELRTVRRIQGKQFGDSGAQRELCFSGQIRTVHLVYLMCMWANTGSVWIIPGKEDEREVCCTERGHELG